MPERRVDIVQIASPNGRWAREFIRFPHRLYARCDQWVPWFDRSTRNVLAKRHPFFDHAEGEYYVAIRDGRTVGRIGVFENGNRSDDRTCDFYFFDTIDDLSVSSALFDAAFVWARRRGLPTVVGPKLFGAMSGQGILVDGFEHPAAMTMMNYNYPYYQRHLEAAGFTKRKDYVSAQIEPQTYELPDKIRRIAEITLARGRFKVLRFKNVRELRGIGSRVGSIYNSVLASFNEGHVLSDREIEAAITDLMMIADPKLIKILTYNERIVGFLLAFPDLSRAIRSSRGRLTPLSVFRLKREFRRTDRFIVNGIGILPEFQRLGGNALMYYELAQTSKEQKGRFVHAEMTQIAESTELMLGDMATLGGMVYKKHRLFERQVDCEALINPA